MFQSAIGAIVGQISAGVDKVSLNGVPSKAKSSMSLARGSLAMVIW
jgi:hypothetical protein